MSTSLTLAKRLRALPDEQLNALVTSRLATTAGLRDFFDVADALLGTDSIASALARQPRSVLDALTTGTVGAAEQAFLDSSLLNTDDGTAVACPEMQKQLDQLAARFGPYAALADSADAAISGATADAAVENALGIVQAIDELAREIELAPVSELSRGGLGAADKARLASLLPVPGLEPLTVMRLAAEAGLLQRESGYWTAGEALPAWRAHTTAEKWLSLAQAWWASLSEAEQRALSIRLSWGPALRSWIAEEYPLDHSWLDALLETHLPQAALLGLSVDAVVSEIGREIVSEQWMLALERVGALVPAYASQVYVQHDFTIVAPGPLAPADDEFMRTLCVVESRGLASTFRMTSAGVDRLLATGLSAADILKRLTELSATEIPQAVSYMITDAAAKYGSVRVRAHEGFTSVTASDPLVLQMIANDRSLGVLGLKTRGDGELACAHPAHVVLTALVEAKYPAQFEDAAGAIAILDMPAAARGRGTKAATGGRTMAHTGAIAVTSLVERLRGTTESTGSDDSTWMARQIDLAVRDKGILDVTVAMPDGSSKDFTIEPKGVSNGRVRAKDRKTEVERTLPIASITSVRRV